MQSPTTNKTDYPHLGVMTKYHHPKQESKQTLNFRTIQTSLHVSNTFASEKPLRSLLKKTSSYTGLEFIERSSAELSAELGASIIFVTKLSSTTPGWVDVLAGNKHGHPLDPWSFNLKGTPCEGIYATYNPAVDTRNFHTGVVVINSNVSERFLPARGAKAQGFLGIPLWDKDQMIGHVAIFFNDMINQSFASESLEICLLFSYRIQAELLRIGREEQIARSMRKLLVANRKLHAQSMHDPLTGLLTRRALKQQWTSHPTEKPNKILLAIGDIDRFKRINDSFGHDNGDVVLREFARRLRQHFHRSTDKIYRLGGEEFALLFMRGDENGQQVSELLLRASRFKLCLPQEMCITASWGMIESKELNFDALYKDADSLLYKAKANGRNCIASNIAGIEPPLLFQI